MRVLFQLFGVILLTVTLSLAVELTINTIPGASIYVNGKLKTQSNDSKVTLNLEPGFYEFVVIKPGYSEESERIELRESTTVSIVPKAFGEINITTSPSARVYINNDLYGISPLKIKLPEGKYDIRIELDGYLPVKRQVILEPFKLIELHQSLIKFGTIQIASEPKNVKVSMNGEFLGITPLSTSVTPGKYTFEFELDGYLSKKLEMEVSQEPKRIFVELEPAACLSISGTPLDAKIFIDKDFKGFSPFNVENLNVGEHDITIEATGFNILNDKISLKKGRNFYNYSLRKKSFTLTFESSPTGAMMFLDEKFMGFTPLSISVNYGKHSFRLKKDDLEWIKETTIVSNKKIFVDLKRISTLILDAKQKDTFVKFNGELIELPTIVNPLEGAYKLVFVNPKYTDKIRYVILEGGKIEKLTVDMRGEGYLNVVTLPQNVKVYWLGQKLGSSPLFMKKVPAGKGILRLVLNDDVEKDVEIEIKDGEYKSIYETVDRMVNVHFTSIPDKCNVYVNGIFIGETPIDFALKPDIYEVSYKKNGFLSQRLNLDLRFNVEKRYLNVILEKVK